MLKEKDIFGNETQHSIFIASVDTETTGLDTSTATMLTCGIVRAKLFLEDNPDNYANRGPDLKLHELKVCGMLIMKTDLLWFCPPDLVEIPPEASKVNGLTMEDMLRHRDEFKENLAELASVCKNYFLLMKNKKYDMGIISSNLKRYGILENVLDGYIFDETDTVAPLYQVFSNSTRRGTLTQHVQMFDKNADVNFHNALEDAKATLWCEWEGIKRIRNSKNAEEDMKELT